MPTMVISSEMMKDLTARAGKARRRRNAIHAEAVRVPMVATYRVVEPADAAARNTGSGFSAGDLNANASPVRAQSH